MHIKDYVTHSKNKNIRKIYAELETTEDRVKELQQNL